LLVALASALLLVTAAAPVGAANPSTATGEKAFTKGGTFIVQLADWPVVAYDGNVKGYKATKPARGSKIDPASTDVVKYVGYLKNRHDDLLRSVGANKKLYDYTYSFNGFAATLTAAQANKLAVAKGVLAVSPQKTYEVDTSSTPDFLGLTDEGGIWDVLGGPTGTRTVDGAGEDIVIGVIDSGVWPESLSFSDRNAAGQLIYDNLSPKEYHGKCDGADKVIDPDWSAGKCNKTLVGAQHFNAAWGGNAALEAARPWEFMSPRDYNGHGTHTSSTAGGNFGVQATGDAAVFGTISGMAPRARIATYKALWSNQDASVASGQSSDLVAAIDQAVADGVDVINYSVSGTLTNYLDPAEVSFLFAAQAGIFVAQSAGNSGPSTSTVAHPGPWTMTVAAGTHNRDGQGSVTLGNGTTYNGASVATPVGPAPLIDSTAAGLGGADATLVALCYSAGDNGGVAVLDPAKVAGKIVVCDRGVTGRTNKSLAVQQAGGVGMILVNTSPNSINADFHFVPTVHLPDTDRAAVKAYAATEGATATINEATVIYNAAAPFTAAFSSRGPSTAGGGNLLKPDIIAPGQDILAAVAPPGANGRNFNLLSGTSMSSPHIAGIAALFKDLKPSWSPAAIKSALMTSASDILDGPNTDPVVIFRQGAGHVEANDAMDPGLVFNAGFNDWLAFLCGTTNGVNPASCTSLVNAGFSTDPSNYNGASIAIGAMAGTKTVTRKVTNVGGSSATYTPSVSGMAGIATEVSPSSLTLAAGATGTFTVTFTRTDAALNAYTGGQLTWTDGSHDVRIPLVVRPVTLAAPAQVSGTGGTINYDVTFGYTGEFTATGRGLVAAVTASRTVLDDPSDSTCSLSSPNAQIHEIAVPSGTTYARFSLFDAFTDGNDDLDLCVFNAAGTNVGGSGSGTSAEEVNLVNPTAGTYRVVVQGWGTDGPDANYTLFSWLLDSTDAGNMTVTAPASATTGATGAISLSFSGLAAGTKYLGSVAYAGADGMPNPTIVRVDTPAAP
jgi:subtilisin family serine protease